MDADLTAKICLNAFVDDENHPAESGAIGVKERIINNAFAMSTKGRQLLDAAKSAADAGRHNN